MMLEGLYRSREGAIFGVCKGIAQYLDTSVFLFRVVMVVLAILSSVWPVALLYILAALLMKPEPVLSPQVENDFEPRSC